MNSAEFKALKGAVGKRLLQQGEFKRLQEDMSSLALKIPMLERKMTRIMKCTGIDFERESIEGGVAFSACFASHTLCRAHETLLFDEILTNEGDGFNLCTGEFTAPVLGKYLISATARAQFHKQISAEVICDGKMVGRITSGYGGIDKAASSITVVVEMKPGNKVFVRQTSEISGEYYGNGYTSFTVMLFH